MVAVPSHQPAEPETCTNYGSERADPTCLTNRLPVGASAAITGAAHS